MLPTAQVIFFWGERVGGGGVPGVVEYPGGLRGKGESNQCGFCDWKKTSHCGQAK